MAETRVFPPSSNEPPVAARTEETVARHSAALESRENMRRGIRRMKEEGNKKGLP